MEPEYRDFRHLEHTGWERAAGEYESRWTDLTSHFIDPLLRAVDLSAGLRFLDVACGPGYVAAAARAGLVMTVYDLTAIVAWPTAGRPATRRPRDGAVPQPDTRSRPARPSGFSTR